MQGNKYGSVCTLLYAEIRPARLVEDALPFLLYSFGFFVKNQVSIGICVYVWVFDSTNQPVCFYGKKKTMQFLYLLLCSNLKSGMVIAPEVLLLYRIVLVILGFLFFHIKLSIILSLSVKNCVGILMGIALNL